MLPRSAYLRGHPFKEIMRLAPSRSKMPNPIPQVLHVRMPAVKDARVMLQPNTPNNGIESKLPQRFGFLPPPKTNKNSQQELIQSSRTHPILIKDTKQSIP